MWRTMPYGGSGFRGTRYAIRWNGVLLTDKEDAPVVAVAEVGEMRYAVQEVGSEPGYLAYWMRRWRGETEFTATEAAKRVGISISRMSDYENGAMPGLSVVLDLAELYGVERDEALRIYAEEDRRRQRAKRQDFVVLGQPALAVYPLSLIHI